MIRLLVIEDDLEEARALEDALVKPVALVVDRVRHAAEARTMLHDNEYDLIVLDLALPPDERRLAPEREEGLELLREALRNCPGTQVTVLSGHADLHLASEFTRLGGAEDLFGARVSEHMVTFFPKEALPDCVAAINAHLEKIIDLDTVELDFDPQEVDLSVSNCRALRIFTRRTGGVRAVVEPLGGGLSKAKTLRLEAFEPEGGRTALAAVKLGARDRVKDEGDRYDTVVARLPVGLGAPLVSTVYAGAGATGALCYRLADDYDRTLFGVIGADEAAAAAASTRLEDRFAEWYEGAATATESVQEVRRRVVADRDLLPHLAPEELELLRSVETLVVPTSTCMQHGDLHGLNVLINSRGEPVIIDYGDVQRANATLDPVTLELSAIFHPDAAPLGAGWPSEAQILHFCDEAAYVAECPYPAFVAACRRWAQRAQRGREEWLASAWAYAARQLQYGNPTQPLARALMRLTGEALLDAAAPVGV